jgi:anti-sigma-K factor RskA
MADPLIPVEPEMDALAAELALGLLDGPDQSRARLEVERLRLEDPAFAAAVAAWRREGLAWLDDEARSAAGEAPSNALWSRIEASVVRRPVAVPPAATAATVSPEPATVRDPGPWKPFALAASLAALVFAGLWGFAPQRVTERVEVPVEQPFAPEALSVAQINADERGTLLSAMYDRETGRLYLRLAEIPDPARVPQLWLIDGTGTPRSLGFGQRGAVSELELTAEQRAIIEGTGTIAVSLEQPAEVPGDTPTDVLGAANLAPLDQS